MALTAHQELQKRKQQKFQRELERSITATPFRKVGDLAEHMFQGYTYKPTLSSLMQMIMASKFGGAGNAVSDGGAAFTLEFVIRLFNEQLRRKKFSEKNETPWGTYILGLTDVCELWNAVISFELDKRLLAEFSALDIDDFEWATDISQYLFLDRGTQAFGFMIVPMPQMKFHELKTFYAEQGIDFGNTEHFQENRFARFVLSDFDSGPMEFISSVSVLFGTTDKLIASLPDRQRHDVKAHPRHYKSGLIVNIAPQKRKNPLRLVVQNDLLTDHIVYCAKDADGQLRYVGEGKRDRWKHVNSGVSHNFKINEHRFTKGELEVTVLYEGLTKTEALSIEKAILSKHSGAGLWNSRDYEPFGDTTRHTISDQEIEEFLNR
jgi:hypothetical protein